MISLSIILWLLNMLEFNLLQDDPELTLMNPGPQSPECLQPITPVVTTLPNFFSPKSMMK
jgi:hypothetical protein